MKLTPLQQDTVRTLRVHKLHLRRRLGQFSTFISWTMVTEKGQPVKDVDHRTVQNLVKKGLITADFEVAHLTKLGKATI